MRDSALKRLWETSSAGGPLPILSPGFERLELDSRDITKQRDHTQFHREGSNPDQRIALDRYSISTQWLRDRIDPIPSQWRDSRPDVPQDLVLAEFLNTDLKYINLSYVIYRLNCTLPNVISVFPVIES